MADQENEGRGADQRGGSMKEDIIQRIREQEARDKQTGGGGAASAGSAPRESRGGGRLFGTSLGKMSVFCRQLATLIDVGIPLLRSLQILGDRTTDAHMKSVTRDLARRVEEGQPLSTAMGAHPRVFSPMFTNVVRAGEAGGILEESMRRLADLLDRRADLRRRVIAAVMYPAIALFVEIVVLCIVVFYALPKLLSAFPDTEELPAVTKAVMGVTNFVGNNWLMLIVVIIAAIVGLFLWLNTKAGHRMFTWGVLRTPVLGNIARKINVARFSRSMGSLLTAGIPLLSSLRITAETFENQVVEDTLMKAHDEVERGGKMEPALRSEPIFEPMVVDMVMVGDEAGALDVMLNKIADTYESEVDTKLRSLTAIIEPLLIVFMGVAVGFVALAVFVPYFSLVNSETLTVQ